MSSNIRVQRFCQFCQMEFTARTTKTMYCSNKCGNHASKARAREAKIKQRHEEAHKAKNKPIIDINAKPFLKVSEVATLLGLCIKSVYRSISNGQIKAVNIGHRITRVRRADINKLFEEPKAEPIQTDQAEAEVFEIADCYTTNQVMEKYGISQTALQNIVQREKIQKIRKGKFAYIPKSIIDKILK